MIAKNTQIEAVINRPRANFREAMRRGKAHGVDNLRIIPCLDASIVPPVETMPHVAPVAERDALFKDCGFGSKEQLHCPLHAIDAVDVPDSD